ncbi:extracellular solute-binding protein [Promicromonospora soli]
MRKPLARAGAAALALAMSMTALAACSPGSAEESGEPTTITMLVLGDKPTNGHLEAMLEKLNVRLEEEANANLDLFYVEWADWQTQYNTQLLSGDDSIDLITTATDWLFAWENAEKGAFLPLSEEMLQENAPRTWEQVDAEGHWEQEARRGDPVHPRGQLHPVDQPRVLLPRRLGHRGGHPGRHHHRVRAVHHLLRVGQGEQEGRLSLGRRRGSQRRHADRVPPGEHRRPDDPAGQRRQLLPVPDHGVRPQHRRVLVHGG